VISGVKVHRGNAVLPLYPGILRHSSDLRVLLSAYALLARVQSARACNKPGRGLWDPTLSWRSATAPQSICAYGRAFLAVADDEARKRSARPVSVLV
jgi:hypothetical protein